MCTTVPGHPANAADNPAVPAGARSAGPDVTAARVLWHSAGPGSAEQVRVPGAVSAGTAAGTQAAAGEVAQGGQGAPHTHTHTCLTALCPGPPR